MKRKSHVKITTTLLLSGFITAPSAAGRPTAPTGRSPPFSCVLPVDPMHVRAAPAEELVRDDPRDDETRSSSEAAAAIAGKRSVKNSATAPFGLTLHVTARVRSVASDL